MSEVSREKNLRALLAGVFGQDAWRVSPDDDLMHELGLDSLAVLGLLAAVEKKFDVRFPDDRLGDIRTLRQLLDLIDGH